MLMWLFGAGCASKFKTSYCVSGRSSPESWLIAFPAQYLKSHVAGDRLSAGLLMTRQAALEPALEAAPLVRAFLYGPGESHRVSPTALVESP